MTYTLKYTGSPLPTDAFLEWDYGDGTTDGPDPLSNHIIVVGDQKVFHHTYGAAGDYSTTLVIKNLVSSVPATVEVNTNFATRFKYYTRVLYFVLTLHKATIDKSY